MVNKLCVSLCCARLRVILAPAQSAKKETDDDEADTVTVPALDTPALSGIALKLSLSNLEARDVGRAETVCKNWREELLCASDVWKQVAINTSSEIAVDAVLASESSLIETCDEDDAPTLSFRRLAIGLSLTYEVGPDPPLPEPRLQPEDLLFLAELNCEGKTAVAYCCTDCSPWFDERKDVKILCDYPQPSKIFDDDKKWDQITFTGRLFRRDTGQSYCLFDRVQINEEVINDEKDDGYDLDWTSYWNSVRPYDLAESEEGRTARRLMISRNMTEFFMNASSFLVPDSKEDQLKLQRVRAQVEWNEKDFWNVMRKAPCFRMTEVTVGPVYGTRDYEEHQFDSGRDILLLLEGLKWR